MSPIIFEPLSSFNSLFLTFIICGVVALAIFIWSLLKNKKILSLLSFIGILICGSSAIMNSLASGKVGTVTIYDSYMATPSGNFDFSQLKSATITDPSNMQKTQQDINIRFASDQDRFLILETAGSQSLIFSDNNYDIQALKDSLDARIYSWYEQQKQ